MLQREVEGVYREPKADHFITLERVEVAASGEMGYTFGKWWIRGLPDNDNVGGRYLAVWKLMEGKWQMVMLGTNMHEDVMQDRTSR